MTRPVQERLEIYAKAMRSTAEQMDELAGQIEEAAAIAGRPAMTKDLRDGVRLYLLFADDLDKLVTGEELKPFIVTGVV